MTPSSVLETPFFSGIDDLDKAFILSKITERRFPKNQIIFYQGDPGLEMYIVKSGALKIFIQEDGKEIVVGHQFPGETIGELEVVHYNNRRLASVAAIESTDLWVTKKANLEDIIHRYPIILRRLFYIVSERLAQADRKISYLAFLDTRLRAANLLLDLHDNFGVPNEGGSLINWKITQQHFAHMIGVNRESAARALQGFQDAGIIRMKERQIIIVNFSLLCQVANDLQQTGNREWHTTYKYNTESQ